jgi:hypothetical protein
MVCRVYVIMHLWLYLVPLFEKFLCNARGKQAFTVHICKLG